MRRRGDAKVKVGESILLISLLVGTIVYANWKHESCVQAEQAVDLTPLGAVGISSTSSVAGDLMDQSWWDEVRNSAITTFEQTAPQTVFGFLNNSQDWKNVILQDSQNPPSWLQTGFQSYLDQQVASLGADVVGQKSASAATAAIQNFAATASGYSLAAVDFASLNGLSAFRTYVATSDVQQALCVTFPGQLVTLYEDAVNPALPRDVRAQYLGAALAVTIMAIALGGTKGLASEFGDILQKAGLRDYWPTIKPYLYDLTTKVSAKASFLAFSVLKAIAAKFPGNSFAIRLTIDRIDWMAKGLEGQKVDGATIENDIGNLVQAANSAANSDDVATDVDVIDVQSGAPLHVMITTGQKMVLYTDGTTQETITSKFLSQTVADLQAGTPAVIEISYPDGTVSYHRYEGGKTWGPTIPQGEGQPGTELDVSFELLSVQMYIKNLQPVSYTNSIGERWVANSVTLDGFTLSGDTLTITGTQQPSVEGMANIAITGRVASGFSFYNQYSTLQFSTTDIFGQSRTFTLFSDGRSPTLLDVNSGDKIRVVQMISYDGVRLRVAYQDKGAFNVATLYMSDPAALYSVGSNGPYEFSPISGVSNAFEIDQVIPVRALEDQMVYSDQSTSYDHGRVGAEIAYVIATEKLGLTSVILNEISVGGPDLETGDGTVVIQARMIVNFDQFPGMSQEEAIQSQLQDLISTLKYNFHYDNHWVKGYAILSYVDQDQSIRTIVLEVPVS